MDIAGCVRPADRRRKLDDNTIQFIIDRTNENVNEDPCAAYETMIKTTAEEMQNLNLFHFRIGNLWLLLIALAVAAIFAACNLIGNRGQVTTGKVHLCAGRRREDQPASGYFPAFARDEGKG